MKRIALAAAAFALVLGTAPTRAAADDPDLLPQDFAYGFTLKTPVPGAPAYRLALPYEVYAQAVRADLGDLRIFNGAREIVPHELRRVTEYVADAASFQPMPLFPLRGDARSATDAVRLKIETAGAAVDLATLLPAAATQASAPITSYIVDLRRHEGLTARLRLHWSASDAAFTGRIDVEASDDLANWRSAGSGSIANLTSGGAKLVANEMALPDARGRFLRLSGPGVAAPFVFERAEVQSSATISSVPRQQRRFEGSVARDVAGAIDYELGASLPIDRLALVLPELNTVARVRVQWRGPATAGRNGEAASSAWRDAGTVRAYRLAGSGDGAEITSPAASLQIPRDSAVRALRLVVEGGLGTFGKSVPAIEAGWVAHEVRFMGRGNGPFTLAYGHGRLEPNETPLAELLPGLGQRVPVATALIGEPAPLGGPSKLSTARAPIDWSAVALWAVLIAGVVLLGIMAWKLAQDVKA